MTETRKRIIEIIEHYMDKTLSEGCLMKLSCQQILWDYVEIIAPLIKILSTDDNWKYFTYLHPNKIISKECLSVGWQIQSWVEILWHYDITAVLKFIDISYRDDRWIPQGHILVELTQWDIHINIWEELYEIPNKPLHLYTEEEELKLLKILEELWNNQY